MRSFKFSAILGLALLLGLAGLVGLAGSTTPVRAGDSLPDRQTPTPVPDRDDDDDDGGPSTPVGAAIVLQVGNVPAGAWGAVQWQDSSGGWQTVEGWQGPLPDNQRWWVAAKDFGSGPFRWAIFSGPGGTLRKASAPFTLPGQPNEVVVVTVGE